MWYEGHKDLERGTCSFDYGGMEGILQNCWSICNVEKMKEEPEEVGEEIRKERARFWKNSFWE